MIGMVLITSAQSVQREGYIVDLQYDTIHGIIDYKSNEKKYEKCVFLTGDQPRDYLPVEILGYGFVDGAFYVSGIEKDLFVEAIVLGQMSLFKHNTSFYFRNVNDEIGKVERKKIRTENEGVEEVKLDDKWRGVISYFFADCLEDPGRIQDLRYSEKQFLQLVKDHNDCKNSTSTIFKSSLPWLRIDPGILSGISFSRVGVQPVNDRFDFLDTEYSSSNPFYGISFTIWSPRMEERLAFKFEAHMHSAGYSALVVIDRRDTKEYHDSYFKIQTISIPVSVTYSIPVKNSNFQFDFGINYDRNYRTQVQLLSDIIENNILYAYVEKTFEVNNYQLGINGAFSYLRRFDHFKVGATVRYMRMNQLNRVEIDRVQGFTAKNQRTMISIFLGLN